MKRRQIGLGIRPVWSESSLSAWSTLAWVLGYPLSAHRRLWSDWANAQTEFAGRSLISLVFVMLWLIYTSQRLPGPRWTYFEHRFRHMFRVRDLTDKWNSWLANITFDWRHVMKTAVERNYQTRQFITFLRFYKIYIKTSQITNKNDVKTKCKFKRWVSVFLTFIEVWMQWVPCKINVMPFVLSGASRSRDPLCSYFDEC